MRDVSELSNLTQQLISLYAPEKVLLFGSRAKNTAHRESDIDLCIVTETLDKRALLAEIYTKLECEIPFDIILYTPEQWERNVDDKTSFAYQIQKEGVVLHG